MIKQGFSRGKKFFAPTPKKCCEPSCIKPCMKPKRGWNFSVKVTMVSEGVDKVIAESLGRAVL